VQIIHTDPSFWYRTEPAPPGELIELPELPELPNKVSEQGSWQHYSINWLATGAERYICGRLALT